MDIAAAHKEAPADPDLSALCGMTSFVTNSEEILKINRRLTPTEVSVLCSLLTSGAEIVHFDIQDEPPPGTGAQLSSAIFAASALRTLFLGKHDSYRCLRGLELFRALAMISANSTLEQLTMHGLSINCWRECNPLEQFAALRSLTIRTGKSCNCSVPALVAGIAKLRTLESLRIEGVRFTGEEIEMLVEVLKGFPLVTDLGICHALLDTKAGRPIGNLAALGRIKKLDVSENNINDKAIAAMVDAILSRRRHSMLEELMLNRNIISSEGGQKVAELVARSPRLRILNLSYNDLGNTIPTLAPALENLNVMNCKLRPHGVESLLGRLHTFPVLHVLTIRDNRLGDTGARAIAQFILSSRGREFTELWVENCGILEGGALQLASVFAKAYEMRTISMSGNHIGPQGATAIIDALATAFTAPMDEIRFEGSRIRDAGAEAVGRLITRRGCKIVRLSHNKIHAAGAKAIADSVAVSACAVQNLRLSDNPLGGEGVKYLLDKITPLKQQENRGVRKLDIATTKMGVEGAMAVKRAVEARGVLYRLNVSNYANEKACKIITELDTWEQNSKPAWDAILSVNQT